MINPAFCDSQVQGLSVDQGEGPLFHDTILYNKINL